MWLRRAFFHWLIPAAFVLPLWLFIGWIIFGASPAALLWVLLSSPIVFFGQLLVMFLIRARGTVRHGREVSWRDIGFVGVWHFLIVALGFFDGTWWWPTFALTIAAGIAAVWSSFAQLWREARPGVTILRAPGGMGYVAPDSRPPVADPEVVVITENPTQRGS